jgi:hypothetical protein
MIRDATIDTSYFGIQFLPVEKKLYLKLQSLLRRLELRIPSLKETFFLYRDQLIWYFSFFIHSFYSSHLMHSGVVFVKMILV